MLSSSGSTWKTLAPPLPNSGLRTMSPCSSRKPWICSLSAGIMGDEQLLGGVADLDGVVDDERLRVDVLEKMRRRNVCHVERRVLAHQHHVDLGEIEQLRVSHGVVVAEDATDDERTRPRIQAALRERHLLRQIVVELMATPLRFEGKREGGIRVDVDRLDRVHLDGDDEGHDHSSGLAARRYFERSAAPVASTTASRLSRRRERRRQDGGATGGGRSASRRSGRRASRVPAGGRGTSRRRG